MNHFSLISHRGILRILKEEGTRKTSYKDEKGEKYEIQIEKAISQRNLTRLLLLERRVLRGC